MPDALNDKVAIVTGAGRGIGRAIALELAGRGAKVVPAARTQSQLDEVHAQIEQAGGSAFPVVCDVTSEDAVRNLFESCQRVFARLDVLVNNAGVGQFVSLQETSLDIWNSTLDTSLKGAFLCCRQALPHFHQSGGGHIINIASIAAVRGFANFAAYSAAKAGLIGFSRALREELRKKGVRVTAVLPGATDSPFWDTVSGTWDRSRMIRCEDVARTVADIVAQPPSVLTEEVILMPAGGAL